MVRYFKYDIIVAVAGFLAVFLWSYAGNGKIVHTLFVVFFLAILEITLSFDNAIINAMRLEKMSLKWQKRFLTWGILIAVFGMRFFFPLLIVAIFSGLSLWKVGILAITNVEQYTYYLEIAHTPLLSFGGTFLMMLFLCYFINKQKKLLWIKPIESALRYLGKIPFLSVIISSAMLFIAFQLTQTQKPMSMLWAGVSGIVLFLIIDGISSFLDKKTHMPIPSSVAKGGLVGFLYLELIDASFSLDGVLGAFALTLDIVLITVGLMIGAMFVRSMTIMLVEKRTLQSFIYLEHGAHWAIGALSAIMLVNTVYATSEMLTGGIGLFCIIASLISSIRYNYRLPKEKELNPKRST